MPSYQFLLLLAALAVAPHLSKAQAVRAGATLLALGALFAVFA